MNWTPNPPYRVGDEIEADVPVRLTLWQRILQSLRVRQEPATRRERFRCTSVTSNKQHEE